MHPAFYILYSSFAQEMARRYNDVLMNGIEKNLNRLYEGPFQSDIAQDRTAHFEIMDACDVIFYNISKGLESMDELRFAIDDDRHGYGYGYGEARNGHGVISFSGGGRGGGRSGSHGRGGGLYGYGGGYAHYGSGGFKLPAYVRAFERYRWPATIALQGKLPPQTISFL